MPEAQLDRFFARISIGYPDRDAERTMLAAQQMGTPVDEIRPVVTLEEIVETQRLVREVFVRDVIRDYILDIVRATRAGSQFVVGASPRSTLGLMRGAQAHAAVRGSDHVRPDDVKAVAPAILGHRVMPRGGARGASVEDAIRDLLSSVPAPVPAR
ncbi:MoxR family ATPase [bacterium]|nr:MAG: MoxR family ATPase [bacterium]